MTIAQAVSCAVALGCITAILKPTVGSQDGDLSTCTTRTGAIARAAQLYWSANDDRLPPAVSDFRVECEDQQLLAMHILPYHGNWMNYRCPADWAAEHALNIDACNRNETPPKNLATRIVTWSQKSHRGYNHLMLSPIVFTGSPPLQMEPSAPVEFRQIANPARTIMFVDSLNDVRSDGAPTGGGSWLVDAPCMRGSNMAQIMPLPRVISGYRWMGGWSLGTPARHKHGYAYQWHEKRFLVAMVDGVVKILSFDEITAGCEPRRYSAGPAYDLEAYLWDIVK